MATYRKADPKVNALVGDVLKRYHGQLHDAGVKVQTLLAFGPRNADGEITGPALATSGWPCAAKVKINSLRDRVAGLADATILLDGDTWPERPDDEQQAIIDHEAQHLDLRLDQEGGILLDDANRPKLKIRLHDWQTAGFDLIADRHKMASLEAQQARDLYRRLVQAEFDFGDVAPEEDDRELAEAV